MTEKETETVFDDPHAFRQRVRLALVQVASLKTDELSYALAYEVEPFSGVKASEAEVAWREIKGDDPSFAEYDVAVRKRGKKGRTPRGAAADRGRRALPRAAAVLACIVLAAVAADFAWTARRTGAMEAELAVRRELDARLKMENRAAASAAGEARRVREEREAVRLAGERVAGLRAACLGAMDAVANACGGNTVIRQFKAGENPFTLNIDAVAHSAQSAADAMTRLSKAAAAKGWTLSGGSITASEGGMTARFDCTLSFDGKEGAK